MHKDSCKKRPFFLCLPAPASVWLLLPATQDLGCLDPAAASLWDRDRFTLATAATHQDPGCFAPAAAAIHRPMQRWSMPPHDDQSFGHFGHDASSPFIIMIKA